MNMLRLIPAALIALMPQTAGAEEVFDPATGLRVAAYRAPVSDSVPGGRVVGADEVAAMAAEGALLIDAMAAPGHALTPEGAWIIAEPHRTIPGAHWLPEIGRGRLDSRIEAGLRASLVDCDRARPVVLFCKTDCWMSWNAVQHLAGLGHGEIGWYPGGVDDWADQGRDLVPVDPLPLGRPLCTMDGVGPAALD